MKNRMGALLILIRVLHRGSMLSNVEVWKSASVALALLTSVLSGLVGIALNLGWIEHEIDPQVLAEVSSALVTLITLVLAYFGVATTEKIGLDPKTNRRPDDPDGGGDDELWDGDKTLPTPPVSYAEPAQPRRRSPSDVGRDTWLGG